MTQAKNETLGRVPIVSDASSLSLFELDEGRRRIGIKIYTGMNRSVPDTRILGIPTTVFS